MLSFTRLKFKTYKFQNAYWWINIPCWYIIYSIYLAYKQYFLLLSLFCQQRIKTLSPNNFQKIIKIVLNIKKKSQIPAILDYLAKFYKSILKNQVRLSYRMVKQGKKINREGKQGRKVWLWIGCLCKSKWLPWGWLDPSSTVFCFFTRAGVLKIKK